MGKKSFFRHRSLYFLPVLLMLGIFACTKPQISFTGVYSSDNSTNVIVVDTFAIKLSTIFTDSFTTSGTKVQLVGRYNDPFFGKITSRSYTEFAPPAGLPTLTNYSTYDSIQLIVLINKSFYGDTTKTQRFLVSQLNQILYYPGIQTAFYSNNSIPYDPTILGSTSVTINPTAGQTSLRAGDSLKITMPNSMGEDLFGLLYRQSDTLKNGTTFNAYFRGLLLYPDTTMPGAVYGFNDTMLLRIYYHEPGVINQPLMVDFRSNNLVYQFNQITTDRTNTPLAALGPANIEIPSTATGNQAFLQPITSVYTKMLFPSIGSLPLYQDYLAVMKAQLIIKPVAGTYSPLFTLPPIINLATTSSSNAIGPTLPYGNGSLQIDYLYGTNTNYTYDITTYIQAAIKQGAPNNAINGLLLITPATSFNTMFNRAVVGDEFNPLLSNQISLKIYYASYY